MRKLAEGIYWITLTLWIGGLWPIGYMVAPVLFATLESRQMAGLVAGRLFELIGWVGLVSFVYVFGFLCTRWRMRLLQRRIFWLLVVMVVLTAVSQFGIQPMMAQLKAEALPRDVMESVLRDRFTQWHGISSILYLMQSMLGLWVMVSANRELRYSALEAALCFTRIGAAGIVLFGDVDRSKLCRQGAPDDQ